MSNIYKPGTKVSHSVYGDGTVTNVTEIGKHWSIKVDFEEGPRTVLNTFLTLKDVSEDLSAEHGNYEPGTKVSHAIFGIGEVKDSKPKGENYRLDIDFENGTSKTLLSTFIEIVSDDSTEEDDGENEIVEAEQEPHVIGSGPLFLTSDIDKIRQAAPQTSVPSVPSDSSMEKLEKLIERRNVGEVTSEEFEEMKKEILKRKPQVNKDSIEIVQEGIHGDELPKKENKDGVVSKSNDVIERYDQTVDPDWVVDIGASDDDKFAKLERLAEMKEKGLINDVEFKQMKKVILEK